MKVHTWMIGAGACVLLGGCVMDQDMWEGIAMGLNDTAEQMHYDNASCYWQPPTYVAFGSGLPPEPAKRMCPGDHGYNPPPPPGSYSYRPDRRSDGDRRNSRDRR